jgi:hypothetical protein
MKNIYALKPCPWCGNTPRLYMDYDLITWTPLIECVNYCCKVNPKSKYVPIRKKQKKDPNIIKRKLEKLISYWNDNNPCIAKEGIELDFDLISQEKQTR